MQDNPTRSLAACGEGETFRLVRVIDQSPEFLRYLTTAELSVGTSGRVVANRAEAGLVSVEVGGRVTSLGREMAEKLLVARAER